MTKACADETNRKPAGIGAERSDRSVSSSNRSIAARIGQGTIRQVSSGKMNSRIAGLSVTTSVLLIAGFDRLSPAEGAFYLLADVSGRTNDSVAFCARMLAEVGIATTPGVDFDRACGNRLLRYSYCGPEADTRAATEWLAGWR